MEELKDYNFYKLVCKTDENLYYIGSSSNMIRRATEHKKCTNDANNRLYNFKIYKIIRANGGFDNFKFINLGNIKNVTKEEAHHTEQAFINLFKPNMNTRNSYLTDEERKKYFTEYGKEWYKDNTEYMKEYSKKYRETHKEEFSEKFKEKITCQCGSIVRKKDIPRHKRSTKHINFMNNKTQSDN